MKKVVYVWNGVYGRYSRHVVCIKSTEEHGVGCYERGECSVEDLIKILSNYQEAGVVIKFRRPEETF